jgi:hypothetical protein
MPSDSPFNAAGAESSDRRQPRNSQASVAFLRRLDGADPTPTRVQLVDRSAEGLALNALIPLAVDARLVVNITETPSRQVLLLCRVAHCTKQKTGRFQIGVAILDQMEGNLHTTRIPDAWRQP